MRPESITRIMSDSCTEATRWAMMIFVVSGSRCGTRNGSACPSWYRRRWSNRRESESFGFFQQRTRAQGAGAVRRTHWYRPARCTSYLSGEFLNEPSALRSCAAWRISSSVAFGLPHLRFFGIVPENSIVLLQHHGHLIAAAPRDRSRVHPRHRPSANGAHVVQSRRTSCTQRRLLPNQYRRQCRRSCRSGSFRVDVVATGFSELSE